VIPNGGALRLGALVGFLVVLPLGCQRPADSGAPAEDAVEGYDGFRYIPEGTPIDLGLAGYAKVICSAVFVSGRDVEEARYTSGFFMMPEDELAGAGRRP
jgi:hypothetical protein